MCCYVPAEYIFAALPRTQRGTPLVLGGDPKGKNFLYTNGNSVIIRDIENPAIADVYTEHSCQVNVAKYSPSGFYIASGGEVMLFRNKSNTKILCICHVLLPKIIAMQFRFPSRISSVKKQQYLLMTKWTMELS